MVEFTTRDGREVRAESKLGSNPAPGRVGDAVEVLYNPGAPEQIRLDTLAGRGGCLAFGFIFFGVAILAVAAVVLIAAAR